MKESSGSQFFRTTTGIQSEPDTFDKSRFIMTFLTILWVKEILCSFRLVLKGKIGKEIAESSRLAFLEELSANDFALSGTEDNISRPLNRGGITDLPLLRTLLAIYQKFREPSFWKVMDSFVLFILLEQTKKMISMNYGSSASSWNHGDEWDLTQYFLWGIYTSVSNWINSNNSV